LQLAHSISSTAAGIKADKSINVNGNIGFFGGLFGVDIVFMPSLARQLIFAVLEVTPIMPCDVMAAPDTW
jgi:hypothetical protein